MTCELCDANARIERGDDEHAIARLTTGYVKLVPNQYFRGSVFFQAKTCAPELHALPSGERAEFLREMSEVAGAVWRAFSPRKLNYELLGNGCPHLHWWLVARHEDDPHPRGPIWEDLAFLRLLWTEQGRLGAAERDAARAVVLRELEAGNVEVEAAY